MDLAEVADIISGTGMAVSDLPTHRSRPIDRSSDERKPRTYEAEVALNAISELLERHKNHDKTLWTKLQPDSDNGKAPDAELTIDHNVQLVAEVSAVVKSYLAGAEVPRSGIAAGGNDVDVDIHLEDGPKGPAKLIQRVSDTQSDEIHKIQLQAATHPMITTDDHVDTLNDFVREMLAAGRRKKKKLRYTKVEVLLISWEESKEETNEEIKRVNNLIEDEIRTVHDLFEQTLHFSVERYPIPITNPKTTRNYNWQMKVQRKVTEFVDDNDGPDTLLILYYNGHGSCHDFSCYWHPTEDASIERSGFRSDLQFYGPHLEWNPIQNSISTDRDLLIILDCCYAGASLLNANKGRVPTTQILAACGKGQKTPAGPNSFTMRFVKAVTDMLNASISKIAITDLYSVMVSSKLGPQPFHVQRGPGNIVLEPLPDPNAVADDGHLGVDYHVKGRSRASSASNADTNTVFSTLKRREAVATDQSSVSSTTSSLLVTLVVRVKEDVKPNAANWEQILDALPPDEADELQSVSVEFEAAMPTNSTMVIVTIPIEYWLLLSENPAYSFLGFVKGNNMLLPPKAVLQTRQVPLEGTNVDEVSLAKVGEVDIFTQIVEAMLEFFESAKSHNHYKERRPGRFHQMATKIGLHPDSPKQSRLETDPYFVKVRHLVQKLNIYRDEKGEYTGLSYDLHFTEIARLLELTKKSVKETIHKVSPPRIGGELEATIDTEFDHLEKEILTKLEEEKISKVYAMGLPQSLNYTKSSTRLSVTNDTIPEADGSSIPRASTASVISSKSHPQPHRKSESLDTLIGTRQHSSGRASNPSSKPSQIMRTDSGFESVGSKARKARISNWRGMSKSVPGGSTTDGRRCECKAGGVEEAR